MYKILIYLFIFSSLPLCALQSPDGALAARKETSQPRAAPDMGKPSAKAGDEVKTEYFNLKIPPGWIMPFPVNRKPDGVSVVFGDQKTDVTVTLNAIQVPLSLKEFTEKVLPGMKKSGLDPVGPVRENGLDKVTFKGKLKGMAWFGSTGKLCAATVVLSQSPDISPANEILGVLKSPTPGLFPKKIK